MINPCDTCAMESGEGGLSSMARTVLQQTNAVCDAVSAGNLLAPSDAAHQRTNSEHRMRIWL